MVILCVCQITWALPLYNSTTWSCRCWSSFTSVVLELNLPPLLCLPFTAFSWVDIKTWAFPEKERFILHSLEHHFKVFSADNTAAEQKPLWKIFCRSVIKVGNCPKQQTSGIWMKKFLPPAVVVFSWFAHSKRHRSYLVHLLMLCPNNRES